MSRIKIKFGNKRDVMSEIDSDATLILSFMGEPHPKYPWKTIRPPYSDYLIELIKEVSVNNWFGKRTKIDVETAKKEWDKKNWGEKVTSVTIIGKITDYKGYYIIKDKLNKG